MSSKVTWLGHSALAIETGGYKLLVDPFLHDNPLAAADPGRVQADFILLSHGHFDHV
ncbi:MAG: MBL fold metallo-hydrolase, partial [Anaerolineales bacterium]|nr:MBL fold metallo-hydrolase [Anaerolineales bacterium]